MTFAPAELAANYVEHYDFIKRLGTEHGTYFGSVAAATAVAALAAVGTAFSAPAPKVVEGSVGPAITIDLKTEQKRPTKPTSRIFRITNVRANASGLGAL